MPKQKRKLITAIALLTKLVELATKYPGHYSWIEMLSHMAHDGETHLVISYINLDIPEIKTELQNTFLTKNILMVGYCDDILDIFRRNVRLKNIQYVQDLAYLALDTEVLSMKEVHAERIWDTKV